VCVSSTCKENAGALETTSEKIQQKFIRDRYCAVAVFVSTKNSLLRRGNLCKYQETHLNLAVLYILILNCMRVCWGIGSGVCFSFFHSCACCWRGRPCFGRGRDRGFVLHISLFLSYIFFYFCGCSGSRCVCACTRAYTQTTKPARMAAKIDFCRG